MDILLDIDLESFSAADLKKVGTYNYASHATTGVWRMSYRFCINGNYGPTKRWQRGQPVPQDIIDHIRTGRPVWGHNVEFEREMWEAIMVPLHGFPPVSLESWFCTMAEANASGYAASLDNLGACLGLEHRKDMGGYAVMMKLAKPIPDKWGPKGEPLFWTEDLAPSEHKVLADYCDTDIAVQADARQRMYRLSPWERKVYLADARINRRGVGTDRPSIVAALRIVELEMERLNARLSAVTGGIVTKLTQRDRLKKWLFAQGVDLENLAKQTIKTALEARVFEQPELDLDEDDAADDGVDDQKLYKITGRAREALEIRREGAKSSTTKLLGMLQQACRDGRLRGLFVYSKAHTRRWASKGVQLQNFPRGTLHLKPEEIEEAIRIIREETATRACVLLRLMFGEPMQVISDCLRSFLVASPGYEFVATDSAQIEARTLAWLCGDDEELAAYERGEDIYCYEAARLFGRPITKADSDERQQGKVGKLAFQYGGGVGAGHSMGKVYGLHLPDERWEALRDMYRATHPCQVRYWRKLEDAARNAILNPGATFRAEADGHPERAVIFKVVDEGNLLLCKLPSGGVIVYPSPRVMALKTPWGQIKDTVTYMGVHPKIKKYVRLRTHGGKLSENVTQSLSRDVLAENMLRFEDRGWMVVMHSHDELTSEMPIGFLALAEANKVLATPPSWAVGLPLGAAGWIGGRYRKDG